MNGRSGKKEGAAGKTKSAEKPAVMAFFILYVFHLFFRIFIYGMIKN